MNLHLAVKTIIPGLHYVDGHKLNNLEESRIWYLTMMLLAQVAVTFNTCSCSFIQHRCFSMTEHHFPIFVYLCTSNVNQYFLPLMNSFIYLRAYSVCCSRCYINMMTSVTHITIINMIIQHFHYLLFEMIPFIPKEIIPFCTGSSKARVQCGSQHIFVWRWIVLSL